MPKKKTSQKGQKASGEKSGRSGCGSSSSVERGKKAGATADAAKSVSPRRALRSGAKDVGASSIAAKSTGGGEALAVMPAVSKVEGRLLEGGTGGKASDEFIVDKGILDYVVRSMPELNTRFGRKSKKFIEKASSCEWYAELTPSIQVLVSALPGKTLAGLDSRSPADRPQLLLSLATAYVEQKREVSRVRGEQQEMLSTTNGTGAVAPAAAVAASVAASATMTSTLTATSLKTRTSYTL